MSILSPLLEKLSTLKPENSVDDSIPAMALRTVVSTLPRPVSGFTPTKDVLEAYASISRVLVPRLVGRTVVQKVVKGVKLPAPPPGMMDLESGKEINPEAVDVLIEVVRCFGPLLHQSEVEAFQNLLIGILESDRASSVVKKRAVVAVSILALYLTDDGLSSFVSQLIESLRNPHLTLVQRRLYITILGSMARSSSARFGPYLKTLAPFVLSALSQEELSDQLENAAEDGETNPEMDDVREAALVALDGFLSSCGNEMKSYTEDTIAALLRFLKYDPNYNDDDDEEMGGTQGEDDDMDEFGDDDEFEADQDFDDGDDDASWKVRRCAAKALYTLISTRASGDLLDDGTLYLQVAPVLVQRFSEREENVRLEIISTMALLVRKTGEGVVLAHSDEPSEYTNDPPPSRKRRRQSSTAAYDKKNVISMSAGLTSPAADTIPTTGPRADLAHLSPALVRSTTKLLKGNSIPTKQALVRLLDDMISVQNGGLADFFGQIVEPIIDAVKSTSGPTSSSTTISGGSSASATASTLRIAALRLFGDIAKTHSSSVLQPYLGKIIPGIVSSVTDRYHKISSEAIGTVEQFVKALTPPRSRSMHEKHKPNVEMLYKVIVGRVSANDADLEVRQRAIQALGILLARTAGPDGSALISTSDRVAALDLLNDRLKNETTRLAAVHAIDTIAELTTTQGQLQPQWIRDVSLELSAQLRKANRSLRGASLAALKHLLMVPANRKALDPPTINGLVSALLPLLTTVDLHLLSPALLVLSGLVADNAKLVVSDQLNTALCSLLKSSISGHTLDAVLTLVANIGRGGAGQKLMTGLLNEVSIHGDPAVVGKVIGTLLVEGGPSIGVDVNSFMTEAVNPQSDDARKCLALAVLGEAGLRMGATSPLQPSTFTSQFTSASEKVPLAAATALGRAGAGNVQVYLPAIFNAMDQGAKPNLLLHSIKEILQQASASSLNIAAFAPQIWTRLIRDSQTEDNKAVGAECIGRLAIVEPTTYIPALTVSMRPQLIIMALLTLHRLISKTRTPHSELWQSKLFDTLYLRQIPLSMLYSRLT